MPVTMVRNTQPGPTVISSDPKGTHFVEWAGLGDPSGGDIQPVAQEIIDTPQFAKALRKGIFEIVDETSDTSREALDKQVSAWNEINKTKSDAINDSIDGGGETRPDIVVEQVEDHKGEGVL